MSPLNQRRNFCFVYDKFSALFTFLGKQEKLFKLTWHEVLQQQSRMREAWCDANETQAMQKPNDGRRKQRHGKLM